MADRRVKRTFGTHGPKYCICRVLWRLVRACVRVRRASKSRGLCCLGGFGWLVAPSPAAARSRPAVRYILDLSSVELVPLYGTLHGFPYSRVFYNGVSGPPQRQQSPIFSPLCVPMPGVCPHSVPVRLVRLSDRPFPSRNPASQCKLRVLPGLPAL